MVKILLWKIVQTYQKCLHASVKYECCLILDLFTKCLIGLCILRNDECSIFHFDIFYKGFLLKSFSTINSIIVSDTKRHNSNYKI